MFRNLFERLAKVREKLNRAKRAAIRRPRKRLEVEPLEERWLLAGDTLLWVGPPGGGFGTEAENWRNMVTGTTDEPENGDTILFDPSASTPGIPDVEEPMQGSNTDCNYQVLGEGGAVLSIANLTIKNGYTSTITLNEALTVNTKFEMQNGTISGDNNLTLAYVPMVTQTSVWSGGKMSGTGTTFVNAGVTLKINSSVALNQRTLTDKGTIDWVYGNILTYNAAINIVGPGTMYARSSGEIKHDPGLEESPTDSFNLLGGYVNEVYTQGKFERLNDAATSDGTTTIRIPFNAIGNTTGNYLAVSIQKGSLNLIGGGQINALFSTGSSTV